MSNKILKNGETNEKKKRKVMVDPYLKNKTIIIATAVILIGGSIAVGAQVGIDASNRRAAKNNTEYDVATNTNYEDIVANDANSNNITETTINGK